MKVLKAQMSVTVAMNSSELMDISIANRRPMERSEGKKFKRQNAGYGRRSSNWKENSKNRKSFDRPQSPKSYGISHSQVLAPDVESVRDMTLADMM